eukprot:TRINITY_DN35851_c0_g2_i1.p2 TRINITY_DN35851_c0_g2~~TRINITY_DN35851_c0_g2_i1.p2  ORF type:complete len:115 (-),score=12.08 TRINITY_DN35851_c0_g2_i1:131-475(-)
MQAAAEAATQFCGSAASLSWSSPVDWDLRSRRGRERKPDTSGTEGCLSLRRSGLFKTARKRQESLKPSSHRFFAEVSNRHRSTFGKVPSRPSDVDGRRTSWRDLSIKSEGWSAV